MKIKEIIKENIIIIPSRDVKSFINRNCKPWIKQNPQLLPVYRGINLLQKSPFVKKIRKDRKPLDTSLRVTAFMDGLMNYAQVPKDGARRTNSAFVCGDIDLTTEFGMESYQFIPIGDFQFTWSPIMKDWYESLQSSSGNLKFLKIMGQIIDGEVLPKLPSYYKLRAHIESGTFDYTWLNKSKVRELIKTTDLTDAILSGHEIMITADEGLYIPHEYLTTFE